MSVQAAIRQALIDRMQSFPGHDIAWEDSAAYQPAVGRPFLKVRLAGLDRMPMANGPLTPHAWHGILSVVVMWPAGEGEVHGAALADQIVAHWPRALTLPTSGIRLVVQAARVQPAYVAGEWTAFPVLVNWFGEESPA